MFKEPRILKEKELHIYQVALSRAGCYWWVSCEEATRSNPLLQRPVTVVGAILVFEQTISLAQKHL
jgi:hypothetical protein